MATVLAPSPEREEQVDERLERQNSGITLRVVLLSLGLAALFGYCIPIVDYKMSNTFLGAAHLPAGAVAVLLIMLVVVNPLLKLISARAALRRNEILTIYITCLFSTLVPGKGGENFFLPILIAPFYFATQENKWLESLQPYFKPWFTPALNGDGSYNSAVIDPWYTGLGPGESIPWGAWAMPLLTWSTAILLLYFMQGCLGVILRAQWAQREALAFPLLRLPIEMTEGVDDPGQKVGGFFRNPLMWIGFGTAVFIELMNGLHLYFAEVPEIPLRLATGPLLSESPWNQIGEVKMEIYPAVLGIAFLLTSEVSFSLWFFHLFSKFQLLVAYLIGFQPATLESPFWTRGWAKGFVGYQQVGAYIAFVGILLWTGREHWARVARRAFGREKASPEEKLEALSYPMAFWGFWGCLTLLIGWTIAAGVAPRVALVLWAAYLMVALGLTRMVAEAGLMFVQTGWLTIGPMAYLFGTGPGRFIDPASAAPASVISGGLMYEMRGILLPSFVQSFKLAHDRKIPLRPLFALILASTLISFVIGLYMVVQMGYNTGGLSMMGYWARNTQGAIHAIGIAKGVETNIFANWSWVGVGMAMTWGMMVARSRFAWFPFHPIGLLLYFPFAISAMWLSLMLGWLAKLTITRFGGNDGYRRTIPLFLGLALGDILMVVFWVVVDGWQGRMNHALLPF
jgi:hypothetical protein